MDIRKLASIVRKEKGILVKFGKTNGHDCLHLKHTLLADKSRSSVTLYDEPEWATHEWNSMFQKERKESPEIKQAVANKT